MSGARRQREAVAPSLFPFLAVLLCTMGALVLILMLIVSGAQASAKQVAVESRQRTEEIEATIEIAQTSYRRQMEDGRVDLEKKRLTLQHFEGHILELLDELADLEKTAKLLDEESTASDEELDQMEQAISELEKQLAEATKKLKQQVAKPDGDKPIFAIIPYEGAHGTHRRPIYLECVKDGVIIQPEGVLIPTEDLLPPHGPGNPLDAALRTIRAEFVPENGAVTRTAYPLLIVRSSGVRSYSLARGAMSGWDDQFGYELIDDDLELTFPESKPGLDKKIVRTIELARERQAAMVMAMPRKYRAFVEHGEGETPRNGRRQLGGNSANAAGDFARIGDGPGGGFGGRSGANGTSGSFKSGAFDSGDAERSAAGNRARRAGQSGDGDWEEALGDTNQTMLGDLHTGQPRGLGRESESHAAGNGTLPASLFNDGESRAGEDRLGSYASGASEGRGDSQPSWNDLTGGSRAGSAGAESSASTYFGDGGGDAASSSFGDQSSSSRSRQGKTAASANGSAASQGGEQASTNGQQANSSIASGADMAGTSFAVPSLSAADPSMDSAQPGIPPLNVDLRKRRESAQPVASSRGRNWAWSHGPATQTAVVRPIHLHCFSDRWVLLPDDGNPDKGLTINFDASPRKRAEQLAGAVLDRVDNWGVALSGGYWKPVIIVDVAQDAAWRFDQLVQLLEGSGLEVRLRERKTGNRP